MPAEKMKTSKTSKTRHKRDEMTTEQRQLVNEYYSTIAQLNAARNTFQNVTDPALISASIYEINALQDRYAFLLGKIKEENITCLQVLR